MHGDGNGVAEISSILVYVGLDLIGDGLMKLPFLRALRHEYPDTHITWLAGTGKSVYASTLAPLTRNLLDEVIENAGIGRRWRELRRKPMAHRDFDLIIDTQRRLKTTLILRRINHKVFISGTANFRLSDKKPAHPYVKKARMIDNMLDLAAIASGKMPVSDTSISINPKHAEAAQIALPGNGPYIGLAPGAGGVHKRWPLENFIAVAQSLEDRGLTPAFLLGPDEAAWLGALRAILPSARFPLQDKALDPALSASPLFTIAVAKRLALAVANDSGTGHMLAAADIPLISLFGPTNPAKFAPYVSEGIIITAQEFGSETMASIPIERVLKSIDELAKSA